MARATYWLGMDWDGDGDYGDAGEDVTTDLRGATVSRGFSNPLARVATVGRATFVLDNSAKSYSPALAATVLPRRKARFSMTVSGTCAPLFDGYIEEIIPTSGSKGERVAVVECSDAIELLDNHEGSIVLYEDVYADDIIQQVVAAVYTPPSTDYDEGVNLFPFAADRWAFEETVVPGMAATTQVGRDSETQASRKILQACTSDWGRFYVSKGGVPTYRNRHAMPLDSSTCATLTDSSLAALGYRKGTPTIYNHVEVTCRPRSVGEVYEVLGQLSQRSAPAVQASASSSFLLYFRDPSNTTQRVGGKDLAALTEGTDYVCTIDPAGNGTVLSGCITATSTVYADRAEIKLSNSATSPAYVQTLQIRGYAVRGREAVTTVGTSASSITAYQRRKLKINANLMNSPADAQLLADYLVDFYESPVDDIRDAGFLANLSSGCLVKARDLELLDRVVISESQTGVAASGHIYHITHRIPHPARHEVRLSIETPFFAYTDLTPFRLDTSALNSGHVLIY